MTGNGNPIRTTLLFGLIGGLLFIPLRQVLVGIFSPPWTDNLIINLIIWVYLGSYGGLLVRRARRPPLALVWPLVPALVVAFTVSSVPSFLLVGIGVLGWIRSGICDPGPQSAGLLAEIVLAFGAAALVVVLAPRTPVGWALGIWLFFVIQSFYYVFKDGTGIKVDTGREQDPFESARVAAERILASP